MEGIYYCCICVSKGQWAETFFFTIAGAWIRAFMVNGDEYLD